VLCSIVEILRQHSSNVDEDLQSFLDAAVFSRLGADCPQTFEYVRSLS
jgi:hypothetical protein